MTALLIVDNGIYKRRQADDSHMPLYVYTFFYSLSLTNVIGHEPRCQSSESPEIFHVFQQERQKRHAIKCSI